MTNEPLFLWLVAGAVGLAIALVAWWIAEVISEVPPEDRTYRDRPPAAFRIMWWPIQWIAYYLGPQLSIGMRQSLLGKLRLAGLDYALAPEQFIAGRVLAALLAAAFTVFVCWGWQVEPMTPALMTALAAFMFPAIWLRDRILLRRREVLKTLPFVLDLVCLCVEAGLNLTGAFQQAITKGPPGVLRDEIARVLRDIRAGKSRSDALRTFADRMNEPALQNLVSALIQADAMGMNLGPILRAQAEQRRNERFARAEKAAMEAPVKMLFPLIAFIFPCTFLVLGFPVVMKFMQLGL